MLRPLLLLPAAALLLTGTAIAQTTPAPGATASPPLMTAPRPDDQPATGAITSPPGVSGEAPSHEVQNPAPPVTGGQGSSPPVAALPPAALNPDQARAMVGNELRTNDGQPAGRILDFTMDQTGDRVDRIVVAPNEVLGLGEKLVALPADMLGNGPTGPVLNIGQADFAKAPTFAYGDEPTLTRPESQQPDKQ
ncbi:PRC-barrel domain containing protein [Azospirillum sp. TSA2s]|uniref:PRC-barrel domain-containing protein n=1 Tax=Azospirillum sp. TSA2s TaxID=709810 RepID=UPI0010AB1AB4|nr:PRC-barrel domain-containing protein [Azospirillum sp. TSA2s]QCG96249.1 PRC-barrel domain containing protein [Azospirillum sp. TSA2s]